MSQAVHVDLDMGASTAEDSAPLTVPYDPARDRESVRGLIALSLIFLLVLIIVLSMVLLWIHPDRSKEVQDWLTLIFGPVIALVGSATGFYFGARDSGSKNV